MNINNKLKKLNGLADLNQTSLAELIGVKQATVSRMLKDGWDWESTRYGVTWRIDGEYHRRFDKSGNQRKRLAKQEKIGSNL